MEVFMTTIQPFLDWLLQSTFNASVVICLILLIQKMLGSKLGPRWSHALWLVLLVRMVLPWAPSSRVSLSNLFPSLERQIQHRQRIEPAEQQKVPPPRQTAETPKAIPGQKPESEAAIQTPVAPKPPAMTHVESESKPRLASIRRLLPVLWLAGAVVIGAYLLVSNFALWRIVKRDRPLVNQEMLELFEECKAQMGLQSLVVVVPSRQIRSPALFGFIRPRLLLPSEMLEKASHEEMRYVFLHELAHLKRRDIYLGWLTSLLQVLHWFNPLVWFAFYRMRTDREFACDALVLARTQKGQSQEYGQAIVGLVRRFSRSRPLPAMAGILESKSQLKRRITMIAQFKKNSYKWSPLGVILVIILACISLPDAIHTQASETSATKAAPELVVRRIWAEAADSDFMGAPSPDGKYLSYVDWTTGDLAVHDLATGTSHKLTNEGWEKGWAQHSVFSPDSKQIAYYWWNNEKGDAADAELRIVGLDGSGPRVVPLDEGTYLRMPAAWSADGKQILALGSGKDRSVQILVIPVVDGKMRVLKTIPLHPWLWRSSMRRKVGMSLSPDGRYVAYTYPAKPDSWECDIFLLAVDGSGETTQVEHPADDFVLGWAPDGKQVVFASDRAGSMGIWAVEVAEGKPHGTPHLLKLDVGLFHPMGFTRNGSYYYGIASGGNNVYVAEYDPQKGNVTGEPVLAIKQYEGSNWAPDWSPDGRYLACVSKRPGAGRVFLIQSVETGEVRELSPDLEEFDVHSLRWSPDGRSLLGTGRTKDSPPRSMGGILRIDVETGKVSTVTKGGQFPNVTSNGKTMFYVSRGHNGWWIWHYDLTTGDKYPVFRAKVGEHGVGAILGLALSPDGKQLAFQDLDAGMLKVISVAGGQPRELVKVEGKITIAWTPDGKHVLYARQMGKSPSQLWRISAEGGEPQKLDLTMPLEHIRFRPDGRRIAFTAKDGTERIEVWAIENLLPEATVAKPPGMAVRRVWARAGLVCSGEPSLDGKYLSYVDWETGDLAVRELATGTSRRLTNKGTWNESSEFAGASVFSPDGRQVAYTWYNKNNFYELRTVGMDSSEPRVLYRNQDARPKPYAWSPDGKYILIAISRQDQTPQMALISVSDGSVRILKGIWPRQADFSPDGRFIVYDDWNEIHVLGTDGNGETTLIDHPAGEQLLGWSPDGEWILFTSDRRGTWDAWAAQISDGKPQGPAELVKLNIGQVFPMGFTHDGSFYYTVWSGKLSNVYTATIDVQAGEVFTKPANITRHRTGENTFAGWSPDGRWVAYFSRPYDKIPPRSTIVIRNVETSEEREINPKIKLVHATGGRWSPDGRFLLLVGRQDQKGQGIYQIDVQSGEVTPLVGPGRKEPVCPVWSSDGKAIYYIQRADEPMRILVRDLQTTREREVARGATGAPWLGMALSPDGQQLAFFARDKAKQSTVLRIVPVGEGDTRELFRVQQPEFTRGAPAWSPNGRQLFVIDRSADQKTHTLWRVSTEDGKAEKLDLVMWRLSHVHMHPDGKQIAFSAHSAQSAKSEVWLMENFLPEDMGK